MARHEVIIYLPSAKTVEEVTPRDFIDKYIQSHEIRDVTKWLQKQGLLPQIDDENSVVSRIIVPDTKPGVQTLLTIHYNGKSYGLTGVGSPEN